MAAPMETLTCRECREPWTRERRAGRKPPICPTCTKAKAKTVKRPARRPNRPKVKRRRTPKPPPPAAREPDEQEPPPMEIVTPTACPECGSTDLQPKGRVEDLFALFHCGGCEASIRIEATPAREEATT